MSPFLDKRGCSVIKPSHAILTFASPSPFSPNPSTPLSVPSPSHVLTIKPKSTFSLLSFICSSAWCCTAQPTSIAFRHHSQDAGCPQLSIQNVPSVSVWLRGGGGGHHHTWIHFLNGCTSCWEPKRQRLLLFLYLISVLSVALYYSISLSWQILGWF